MHRGSTARLFSTALVLQRTSAGVLFNMKNNMPPFSGEGFRKETNVFFRRLRCSRGSLSSQDKRRARRYAARMLFVLRGTSADVLCSAKALENRRAVDPRCMDLRAVQGRGEGVRKVPEVVTPRKTTERPALKKSRLPLFRRPLPPTVAGCKRELKKLQKWYPGALARMGARASMHGTTFWFARVDVFERIVGERVRQLRKSCHRTVSVVGSVQLSARAVNLGEALADLGVRSFTTPSGSMTFFELDGRV